MSKLTLAFLTLFVLGCSPAYSSFSPTNASPRMLAPRGPDSVELFIASQPQDRFTEVGLIRVKQGDSAVSHERLLEMMREQAAQQGCDAVIVGGSNDSNRTSVLSSLLSPKKGHGLFGSGNAHGTKTEHGYYGACIVFDNDESNAAATMAATERSEQLARAENLPRCERDRLRARLALSHRERYEIIRDSPSKCTQ